MNSLPRPFDFRTQILTGVIAFFGLVIRVPPSVAPSPLFLFPPWFFLQSRSFLFSGHPLPNSEPHVSSFTSSFPLSPPSEFASRSIENSLPVSRPSYTFLSISRLPFPPPLLLPCAPFVRILLSFAYRRRCGTLLTPFLLLPSLGVFVSLFCRVGKNFPAIRLVRSPCSPCPPHILGLPPLECVNR